MSSLSVGVIALSPVRCHAPLVSAPRDDSELGDLADLVHGLYAIGDWKTWAAFAAAAGYPATNLSNVKNAKNAIEGPNLVKLIRAAAERSGGDPAVVSIQALTRSRRDRLRELEDAIDAKIETAAMGMAEILERIDARLARVEARLAEGDEGAQGQAGGG